MTVTLDLDPALVARARAEAEREGTTLARFVEQLVATRLAAAVGGVPAPSRSSQEILDALARLGPASQEFEDAIRESRTRDAAAEAQRRTRLDARWADEA